jgi:hypothetical protein
MMRVAAVALWSALLVILPITGRAATISGHVRVRGSGEVIPGARVTLCGGALSRCRAVTADAKGFYRFIGVPSSKSYSLRPELGGLSPIATPIGYVFQDDRVNADVALATWIICGITIVKNIPENFSPPSKFRIRAVAMNALP